MEAPIHVVGHLNPDTDSVCSAIAYADLKNRLGGTTALPARAGELNAETAFVLERFGVPVPVLLLDAEGLDLILVDHNEIAQALPNIEKANVHEIWEHHRLGDLRPREPITIHCEPVGATATLIAEQYFLRGLDPEPAIAGILVASVLSDTLGFRSPTTTDKDRTMVERLGPLARVEIEAFARELRQVRLAANARMDARGIVGQDFKEFRVGDARIGIAQVEVSRSNALDARRPEILDEMRAVRDQRQIDQVILMVTDVESGSSDLWVVGERLDLFELAFGILEEGIVHLPGCMSRKKQVVPRLEDAALSPVRAGARSPEPRMVSAAARNSSPSARTDGKGRRSMATPPVRRLLVAVDFSPSSGEALRLACRMADALGASVEALHILEAGGPATAAPAPPSDADLASARERLRAFVAEARGACPVVVTERVEGGEVQARVVAAGEEGGFDLIVMGTHGRTGREHAFVGSVASSVVRTATRPVLTVREGTTAAS